MIPESGRPVGVALAAIGLGWIGLSRTAASSVVDPFGMGVVDPLALGVVYLAFGLVVGARGVASRSAAPPFLESVATGAVALALVAGIMFRRGFASERGPAVVDIVTAPSFLLCYFAAWLFAIGIAATRRQRYVGGAGVAAVPLIGLLAVPVLVLLGGGWLIVVAIAAIPLVLGLFVLSVIVGFPLLYAGYLLTSDRAESDAASPERPCHLRSAVHPPFLRRRLRPLLSRLEPRRRV